MVTATSWTGTRCSSPPAWECSRQCGRRTPVPPKTCLAIATQDGDAPLATRECQAVAALFGPGKAKLLLGEEATAAAVRAAAPGCDVIHFAGHGIFDPENPMHSHLRLSGGTLSASDTLTTGRPSYLSAIRGSSSVRLSESHLTQHHHCAECQSVV
ncbi:MAG: CHAT domain-containing protein [Bacillota bacterium]